jgi:ABC-type glycerol-3-phosphate transport system substrate-binding protein
MKYFKFLIFILALLLLVGCTADESDRIFEEVLQQRPDLIAQEDDGAETPSTENVDSGEQGATEVNGADEADDEPPFVSDLYGTLTVLTEWGDSHTAALANRFMELHPGVEIIIEELDSMDDPLWGVDLAEQTALITRLLASPPDIFNTGAFAFEKVNFEQLFLDLNEFIDGPNGINREDYFDNILRAAEVNGNLYSVPLMFGFTGNTNLLNKRYFEAIGVPIDEMRAITLSEYLDFHRRAAELFPEDDIGFDIQFNMFDVFRFERVHDVNTGVVNADTPEMREMLEYINSVRIGSGVSYMPETVMGFLPGTGHWGVGVVDRSYTNPSVNYMYHSIVPAWVFFMQDHPQMRFSHPVHRMTQNGDIMFRWATELAIMRGSQNHDLAWEFLRFYMEFNDSLVDSEDPMTFRRGYHAFFSFPVNRHLFNAQYRETLIFNFRQLVGNISLDGTNMEARVDYAMLRFTELIEMINARCRFDRQAMNSIIYPDIFQFHLGNQDVYATLRSIQNRLEIYVAE